ncbi:MAG TPA: ribosome biogenesis GTP-binding protein YihA/YsxC [Syntrophomonadaceae bacterium]|nr:ribosome biogenesis GTP-binding protein YihA/YsxC [Syntrophomonadaceae bacterium]HNX28243.1 ribosome biogenesis GTP-binding protein YihA/YsxC [Syntrophomonadaceae bacterium]HPR92450.1 ribosome biogenesis GTP-binding protein YihA/YsxC [Syntrophomonadaceae bacterium]
MLTIKKAEYIGSFVEMKQLPPGILPEIAIVGRSNVGKSSLINKTVNRKKLAKSSSTPGKTQTINYYLLNDDLYLVDLPGYGYAKAAKTQRLQWQKMIEKYLRERQQLRGVIILLDIRHEPSQNDIQMKDWLTQQQIPLLVIATKADKVSRGARSKHINTIRKALNLSADMTPISFSAETGEGTGEVLEALEEITAL